jgi:alkylhydroperoxidase family enzyme
VRSAAAQQKEGTEAKLKAVSNIEDPLFTPRERSALEMASVFTERYKDFTDADLERWKKHFTDEEMIELAVFMALADGFGKVVEMLGLGAKDQVCSFEV